MCRSPKKNTREMNESKLSKILRRTHQTNVHAKPATTKLVNVGVAAVIAKGNVNTLLRTILEAAGGGGENVESSTIANVAVARALLDFLEATRSSMTDDFSSQLSSALGELRDRHLVNRQRLSVAVKDAALLNAEQIMILERSQLLNIVEYIESALNSNQQSPSVHQLLMSALQSKFAEGTGIGFLVC
jgi:hypothetical protein